MNLQDSGEKQFVDVILAEKMRELGLRVRNASKILAVASTNQKNEALYAAANGLRNGTDEILRANQEDIDRAQASGVQSTVIDRLRLDRARVEAMAAGMDAVAKLPDPIGEITQGWVRPNGLQIHKVRVPLGVIGIIYENRPNVTSDAAALCLKSGNGAFLRGSSGAISSNICIATILRKAFVSVGLPEDSLVLVEDTSREAAVMYMQLRGIIDCLIPRGGPSLLESIYAHATVPYVIDGDGNCHIYVDEHADLDMAEKIVVNAKTQRPSVCNAAESLIVHESIADKFLPRLPRCMPQVEFVVDAAAKSNFPDAQVATDEDFGKEFLDFKLSVKTVSNIDEAIAHIRRFGSGHSEAIITNDLLAANRFTREVDAAAVLVNASTRFVDGEEFGFGAEIGISTQKLHARGPMGLPQLTTEKFVVVGNGQVRG